MTGNVAEEGIGRTKEKGDFRYEGNQEKTTCRISGMGSRLKGRTPETDPNLGPYRHGERKGVRPGKGRRQSPSSL